MFKVWDSSLGFRAFKKINPWVLCLDPKVSDQSLDSTRQTWRSMNEGSQGMGLRVQGFRFGA